MIFLIIFLGFALRLVLINQSLWLDEAIGAVAIKTLNYRDLFTHFFVADNHPPFYYLFLKFWTSIFGYSEISPRMPSILFGIGIIYLVYLITKNKFTAILVATSPLLIYYSQEARMYMMAGFFATLAVYAFLNKKFTIFSLSILTLIFTDYVPVFILPVFLIYSIYKKEDVFKTLLSYSPMVVIGLLWLPFFVKQAEGGRQLLLTFPAWRSVAGGATIHQLLSLWSKFVLGRISFYNKTLYGLLIFVSSLPIIYSLVGSIKNKKNLIFWLWLLVPSTLCFLASFWIPAFIYFRFIFIVPAFYILLNANTKIFYLLLLINLLGYSIYLFNPRQHREDWKSAVTYVEENINADELVVFENTEPFAPYMWYEKRSEISYGGINRIPAEKSTIDLKNKSGVYYFEYLKDLQDPNNLLTKEIISNGFFEVDKKAFNGVGFVVHYKKQNSYAYSN